jgi:polysaccharide biosynthesis protein PslG
VASGFGPGVVRGLLVSVLSVLTLGGSAASLLAQTGDESASLPSSTSAAVYRAASPEYGMHLFVLGDSAGAQRDFEKLAALRFTWQKSMLPWRVIEPERGNFQWDAADQLVQASSAAGIKLIARVDSPPDWARSNRGFTGPPDRLEDFEAFVFALVDRYRPGSELGTIDAIEIWNEPNLDREWGGFTIDRLAARQYVNLLCAGNRAAKRANPDIVTISAALSPTGTTNGRAMDDVIYLGWLYDVGMRPCFDVLGAHGVGYKAPPWISPEEIAANKQLWGGHASFGFRRVEQLRQVMVRYGDANKQIWLTEFGWTSDPIHQSYAWHRVTEQQKAEYIVGAFQWAATHWRPWIGVMVVWNMPASDWGESREEYWWSITNPDGTTRAAYDRLLQARTNGQLP